MQMINKQLNIEPNPAVEWDDLCSKIEKFSICDQNEKNQHLLDNEEDKKRDRFRGGDTEYWDHIKKLKVRAKTIMIRERTYL